MGPWVRVPGIIISPFAKKGFIDHTQYETVSILKLIEKRWKVKSLNFRDKQAAYFLNSFDF
jgi:phospholipase C